MCVSAVRAGGGKVKKPGVDLYPWMFTFSLCQLLIVLISYSVIWGTGASARLSASLPGFVCVVWLCVCV